MSDKLARMVRAFADRVRARPSESVGPELDRLAAAADEDDSQVRYAQVSPVANVTWMQRLLLDKGTQQTALDPMEIPYACEIVGVLPTILLVDTAQGVVEPPAEAIDVFLQLNRAEVFTSRSDKTLAQDDDENVINLPALDQRIRSMAIKLRNDDPKLNVRFRWAVPLATVTAMGWGSVQISMSWFVQPELVMGSERRFGR